MSQNKCRNGPTDCTRRTVTLSSRTILKALCLVLCTGARAQEYDAAANFSPTGNPNGTWSYGWSDSLGGSFVPFDSHRDIPFVGPPGGQEWLPSNYDPAGYQDIV